MSWAVAGGSFLTPHHLPLSLFNNPGGKPSTLPCVCLPLLKNTYLSLLANGAQSLTSWQDPSQLGCTCYESRGFALFYPLLYSQCLWCRVPSQISLNEQVWKVCLLLWISSSSVPQGSIALSAGPLHHSRSSLHNVALFFWSKLLSHLAVFCLFPYSSLLQSVFIFMVSALPCLAPASLCSCRSSASPPPGIPAGVGQEKKWSGSGAGGEFPFP